MDKELAIKVIGGCTAVGTTSTAGALYATGVIGSNPEVIENPPRTKIPTIKANVKVEPVNQSDIDGVKIDLEINKNVFKSLSKDNLEDSKSQIKATIEGLNRISSVADFKDSNMEKLFKALKVLDDGSKSSEYDTNIETVKSTVEAAYEESVALQTKV